MGIRCGNGERGNSLKLSFNEQRQRGMLPRASVHAEDVNSNEELNRQRVQAGQIASIFSVSTCSCHVFGLSFCILAYREVKMGTYRERSILRRTTVLWRMWFQVPTTLKCSQNCQCTFSGRGRLREINSASTDTTEMTHPLPVSSGNPPVCLTHTEVRVELPPTMPKPNVSMISSYSEHTDGLVVVAGVAIGGAPVTVEKKKRGRPPKHPDDTSTATYKKRDNRVCGKCKSSGRIEAAKTCKGRGGVKFCPFVDSQKDVSKIVRLLCVLQFQFNTLTVK